MPVFQSILLGILEEFRRVAVLVEVLREPAFAAGEVDERHRLVRLRIDEPVLFHGRVSLQRQPFLDLGQETLIVLFGGGQSFFDDARPLSFGKMSHIDSTVRGVAGDIFQNCRTSALIRGESILLLLTKMG